MLCWKTQRGSAGPKFGNLYLREGQLSCRRNARGHATRTTSSLRRNSVFHPADSRESRRSRQLEPNRSSIFADVRTDQYYLEKDAIICGIRSKSWARGLLCPCQCSRMMSSSARLTCTVRSSAIHRQADRDGEELRRSGRHRHREHALAERTARILQQQTATADVLKVISSSPGELEPVFEAMLANATRICDAKFGILSGTKAACFILQHRSMCHPLLLISLTSKARFAPKPGQLFGRLCQSKKVIHELDRGNRPRPSPLRQVWRRANFNRGADA